MENLFRKYSKGPAADPPPMERLFLSNYSKEVKDRANREIRELNKIISKHGLFMRPMRGRLRRGIALAPGAGFAEDDLDYPAMIRAKIANAHLPPGEVRLVREKIQSVLSACEALLGTLNCAQLDSTAAELIKSPWDPELRKEELFPQRKRLYTTLTPYDCGRLQQELIVFELSWVDLFAWKIPELYPEVADRSRSIGRRYWTMHFCESIWKGASLGYNSEALAGLLRFPS